MRVAILDHPRGTSLTRRRPGARLVLPALGVLLVAAALAAAAIGAYAIPLERVLAGLGLLPQDPQFMSGDTLVLWSIRLPRIGMAAMVGAMLACAGALMQGLFRNPLADPALVGVSSGAALAASGTIVFADRLGAWLATPLNALPALWGGAGVTTLLLPIAAFAGALVATLLLYRIATRGGRTSIALFLLGGLAIAALTNAMTGLLVYVADDRQLRDISFWLLGSLAGATWSKAATLAPFVIVVALVLPRVARGLDLMAIGETEAFHAGVAVERLKLVCVLAIAAMVGASVAFAGMIGFVGIAVPHLLRLMIGPGHRLLLPASLLLGAVLMLVADTIARTIIAPAELPVGIVTALIGAPFFLYLLLRQRGIFA